MAITEDVVSKWYQALFEEDCLVVMDLLNAHPSLLMIGRESEPSRKVEGRRRREGMGRTQSTWKGRTALHVGASRGCLQLIIQVLGLCIDDFSKINELYHYHQKRLSLVEKFSFSKIQVHPKIRCNLCWVCPILGNRWKSILVPESPWEESHVEVDYNLCQKCYEQQENQVEGEFVKIETGLPNGPTIMDTWYTKRSARDPIKEAPGELADLLHAKDGECGLNAVAIAALNGNQEVMALLCHGMEAVCSVDHRQRDNTRVLHTWAASVLNHFALSNLRKRKLLRRVMVERARAGHVDPTELKEYYEHRDFNFLPPEEYLFHFSFADARKHPNLLKTPRFTTEIRWKLHLSFAQLQL